MRHSHSKQKTARNIPATQHSISHIMDSVHKRSPPVHVFPYVCRSAEERPVGMADMIPVIAKKHQSCIHLHLKHLQQLPDLIDAGVDSLKIEGRMKSRNTQH